MSSSPFAPDDSYVFKSKLCCAVDLKLEKRVVIRKAPKPSSAPSSVILLFLLSLPDRAPRLSSPQQARRVSSLSEQRGQVRSLLLCTFPLLLFFSDPQEYIPGGSLCSFLLRHGPLTEKGVRKVFRQLLPLLKDKSLSILPGDFRLSQILLRTSDSIDEVVLLPEDSLLMVGLGATRSSQSENPFNLLLENMEYFSRERVLFQSFQSTQDLWSIGVLFFVL